VIGTSRWPLLQLIHRHERRGSVAQVTNVQEEGGLVTMQLKEMTVRVAA
jgi:hypothetical protein